MNFSRISPRAFRARTSLAGGFINQGNDPDAREPPQEHLALIRDVHLLPMETARFAGGEYSVTDVSQGRRLVSVSNRPGRPSGR